MLGEFIYNKTHGNPFFINQFMKSIHDNRLFVFDEHKGWRWDLPGIKKLPVSDNVVDLLIDRINKMDLETRTLLMVCSCFGGRFNPEDLVAVTGMEPERIIPCLDMIESQGLVDDIGGIYVFSHDRIIEAAYSLIPDQEKENLHYRIGSMYLNTFGERERDENISLIVNQLNAGRKKIENAAEKKNPHGLEHYRRGKSKKIHSL
jgi:predicted ATPase